MEPAITHSSFRAGSQDMSSIEELNIPKGYILPNNEAVQSYLEYQKSERERMLKSTQEHRDKFLGLQVQMKEEFLAAQKQQAEHHRKVLAERAQVFKYFEAEAHRDFEKNQQERDMEHIKAQDEEDERHRQQQVDREERHHTSPMLSEEELRKSLHDQEDQDDLHYQKKQERTEKHRISRKQRYDEYVNSCLDREHQHEKCRRDETKAFRNTQMAMARDFQMACGEVSTAFQAQQELAKRYIELVKHQLDDFGVKHPEPSPLEVTDRHLPLVSALESSQDAITPGSEPDTRSIHGEVAGGPETGPRETSSDELTSSSEDECEEQSQVTRRLIVTLKVRASLLCANAREDILATNTTPSSQTFNGIQYLDEFPKPSYLSRSPSSWSETPSNRLSGVASQDVSWDGTTNQAYSTTYSSFTEVSHSSSIWPPECDIDPLQASLPAVPLDLHPQMEKPPRKRAREDSITKNHKDECIIMICQEIYEEMGGKITKKAQFWARVTTELKKYGYDVSSRSLQARWSNTLKKKCEDRGLECAPHIQATKPYHPRKRKRDAADSQVDGASPPTKKPRKEKRAKPVPQYHDTIEVRPDSNMNLMPTEALPPPPPPVWHP